MHDDDRRTFDALRAFKAAACRAERVAAAPDDRSVVARCLAETLRVFPPVWTLARRTPSSAAATKGCTATTTARLAVVRADVLTMNANQAADGHLDGAAHARGGGGATPYGGDAIAAVLRAWDPQRARDSAPLASFGLGQRSCPAGAAGLVAAFIVLRAVLADFDVRERTPGHAVRSARLGPTLTLMGPQLFEIRRRRQAFRS